MSSIRVVVRMVARSGSEEVVRGTLAGLVEPVRAEPGCLGYDVYESATEPGTFFDIAEWAAQDAQDAHLMTPHVQEALAALDGHLRDALDVHPLNPIGRPRPAPVP